MKIYPSAIPDDIAKDPFKGSELAVYRALEAASLKGVALYSVLWNEIDRRRAVCREGEADFLVILPSGVVLTIEVKGGRISADIEGWYTTDRNNVRHPIMSPLEQAQRSKYAFKRQIEKKFPGVRFGHLAIFPNINRKDFQPSIDCPHELLLFNEDLDTIADRIREIAGLFGANAGRIQADALAQFIKPRRDLAAKLGSTIHQLDRAVESLTDSQYAILKAISGNKRVSLTGPAGSGKSVLGLRWARDAIATKKSVMSFSPHRHMRDTVAAFLGTKLGHWLHQEAISVTSTWRADAILVEEAQDLPLDKWDAIECLSRRCGAMILAIYDSNQQLAPRGQFYLPDNMVEVSLHTVIRNSDQIAKFSMEYYSGNLDDIRMAGPNGPDVVHVDSSPEALLADVRNAVLDAVRNHGFDYNSIIVISGSKDERKSFIKDTNAKIGDITFRSGKGKQSGPYDRSAKVPIVSFFNHMQFRGLESPVVILTDIDQLAAADRQIACYVGASRAKYLLYVIHSREENGQQGAQLDAFGAS